MLLFEKSNGFHDSPAVDAADTAFVEIARRNGWSIVTTDKGGAFTPAILPQFDAVIYNNISGDGLTLVQRRAFRIYMERGGGFVGVHGSAGDPVYFWDWYADGLIVERLSGHPIAKEFQSALSRIEDSPHPIADGLPVTWSMTNEWHFFRNNPRAGGSHTIATLDENSYDPSGGRARDAIRMGDHPITWTRCISPKSKRGRAIYSAIGHRTEQYSDQIYVQMLGQGILWAVGLGKKTSGQC